MNKVTISFLLLAISSSFADLNGARKYVHHFWTDYDGELPNNALQAEEGVYIAQALIQGYIYPGSFYSDKKIAVFNTFGRKITLTENFKIMCTDYPQEFQWEYVNINSVDGSMLAELPPGGFEDTSVMYIGKVFHDGEWKVSKVYPLGYRYQGLGAWYEDGTEYHVYDFEILKYA